MNLVKSKGVAFESAKEQTNDFAKLYEESQRKKHNKVQDVAWGGEEGVTKS